MISVRVVTGVPEGFRLYGSSFCFISRRVRRFNMTDILSDVVREVPEGDQWRSIQADLRSVFCLELTMNEMTFAEVKRSSV